MKVPQDILVLGAGVVGMATALTLFDRGHRVTVLDQAAGPGLGTSFANGAQLSYAYTDALASPSILTQMPRLLLALDPAFRLRPSLDPEFLRWVAVFLRNTTAARFQRNTLHGLALALRSRAALHQLTARHSLDFAHATPGKLHLFRSTKSFETAQKTAMLKASHGVTQRVLSSAEAVAVEPALASISSRIIGALHTPDEEVGDPHRFCVGASAVLGSADRASLMFGTHVDRIETDGARPKVVTRDGIGIGADQVILCAGGESVELARGIGARLPILPMKGYSITAPPGGSAPRMSVTDVANRVVFARLGDRIRIAGLADLGNSDTLIDPVRLASLIASARAALPEAADYDAVEMSWAGLRPMTPDSLPITRRIARGVVANTGHGALGWTYAAGSAEQVAEIVEE